jgi:hypothetical protein
MCISYWIEVERTPFYSDGSSYGKARNRLITRQERKMRLDRRFGQLQGNKGKGMKAKECKEEHMTWDVGEKRQK